MKVLFIGAHPDDIELGACGLVRRLVDAGHDIWLLILAGDDRHEAGARREKAIRASERLEVSAGRTLFAGLRDGQLHADRATVSRVRQIAGRSIGSPDVVVTHTSADSHHDHVEANQLARSAFRETVMLFYGTYLSAELFRFSPRFYSSLTPELVATKEDVLKQHLSQAEPISGTSLPSFEAGLGGAVGLARAEAFEIEFQIGAQPVCLSQLMTYNDSPFHKMWVPLLGDDPLYLLYENFDGTYPNSSHESVGRDVLREAFVARWFPRTPLSERHSGSHDAPLLFERQHTLLAGGPVSNVIARDYFNRLRGVDWIVDFDLPERHLAFLLRRSDGRRFEARYRGATLTHDLAVLSVGRNPYDTSRRIVSCAGVHSEGTRALLEFLAVPDRTAWLMDRVLESGSARLLQVPVSVDVADYSISPLDV